MKKIITLILLTIIIFNLSGCGKDKNSLQISFDRFQLNLENKNNRLIVSPSTISNTQIVEKIIKIIKSKNNKNLSIIIAKSEIKNPDIDFKTFVNANIEKFNKLIGYKFDKLDFSKIKCEKEEVPIAIHYFELDQSMLDKKSKTYFYGQIYVYLQKYGYVIQVYSTDKSTTENVINDLIDNLKCK